MIVFDGVLNFPKWGSSFPNDLFFFFNMAALGHQWGCLCFSLVFLFAM